MLLFEGWQWRQKEKTALRERSESVTAYFVARLLNVSGKTIKGKISVKDLLGPLTEKTEKKQSDKEYLLKTFGIDGG